MSELTPLCDIVWAEQDADIAVELGLLALSGATRPAGFAVLGQVPPQFLSQTFLRIDVAVDRFLADPQSGTLIDHAVADLLGCPIDRQAIWQSQICREGAVFDPFNDALAQIGVPDQFALYGSPLPRALMSGHSKVTRILLGEGIIGPEVTLISRKIVDLWRFKTRAISATGTFASHQSSILRRS